MTNITPSPLRARPGAMHAVWNSLVEYEAALDAMLIFHEWIEETQRDLAAVYGPETDLSFRVYAKTPSAKHATVVILIRLPLDVDAEDVTRIELDLHYDKLVLSWSASIKHLEAANPDWNQNRPFFRRS